MPGWVLGNLLWSLSSKAEGKLAEGTEKGSKRALRRTLHTSAMSKDDVGDQL